MYKITSLHHVNNVTWTSGSILSGDWQAALMYMSLTSACNLLQWHHNMIILTCYSSTHTYLDINKWVNGLLTVAVDVAGCVGLYLYNNVSIVTNYDNLLYIIAITSSSML